MSAPKKRRWWVVVALLVLVVQPLGVYWRQHMQQRQLDGARQTLLQAPSLTTQRAQSALALLRATPARLADARRHFALLLTQTRGRRACRCLKLLYALAPRSHEFLSVNLPDFPRQGLQMRDVSALLTPHLRQNSWGPIVCPPGQRLLWMRLTPTRPTRLRLLWRSPKASMRFLHAEGLELHNADWRHSDLSMARLEGTTLAESQLMGVDFSFARLQGASLIHAKLEGAIFRGADLRGVNLLRSDARFADFRKARLAGVKLTYGKFGGALFDADALPILRRSGLHATHFRRAVCLSGGSFLMRGPVDDCYRWHRQRALKRTLSSVTGPRHCPQEVGEHAMFVAYPPGQLHQEGRCPWRTRQMPLTPALLRTLGRPSSRPSGRLPGATSRPARPQRAARPAQRTTHPR